MREVSAAWLLIVLAVLVQHSASVETLSDSEESPSLTQDPVFSRMLGEANAPSPNQLSEQNSQLQGAIQAIEQGTPPPGMEAMMGGGAAPKAGGDMGAGAGAATGKASAISEGIKMAMKSVKPLMDKYVATARALTNKYTLLKKRYQKEKETASGCPKEEDTKKRIADAVAAATAEVEARYKNKVAVLQGKLKSSEATCSKKMQTVSVQLAKARVTLSNTKEQFLVELAQARGKAKTEVTNLHTELKEMMMNELDKRDAKVEKEQKAQSKESDEKAKEAAKEKASEAKEKKDKADKDLAGEKNEKAKEKQSKNSTAKEERIKAEAAEEARQLNRKTVLLKARQAVQDARVAARMARKMSHDADTNLENARLQKAKTVTEDDIKALSKLRHHEDLAQTAVDSAKEKKEKVSRYEYTAKTSLDKSVQRSTMVAKKNRWEERRIDTLSDIASMSRDKAEALKTKAEVAAEGAGIKTPVITLPLPVKQYTPKAEAAEEMTEQTASESTRVEQTAHEERKLARHELEKDGVPVPKELKKGAMKELDEKKAQAAAATAPSSDNAEEEVAATDMKKPNQALAPGATQKGHETRDAVRQHSSVEEALLKTKVAKVKLDTALVKRSVARKALRDEGKSIPDNLKKGGLAAEKKQLEAAAAKAKAAADAMESKEESATAGKKKLADEAMEKIDEASEKREEAREFLEKEGKPVPEALEKGGMDEERKQVETDEEAATGTKITDVKPDDTDKTIAVKKQAVAREADLKAQVGVEKTKLAGSLRQKARTALKSEGKEIPDDLTKKDFDPIRKRAKAALQKAKQLKAEAGLDAVEKGVGPPGVSSENAKTCYEADLSKYPDCKDYEGYSCSKGHEVGKSGYCAADSCINCKKCAKAAPAGHVINVSSGRCEDPFATMML